MKRPDFIPLLILFILPLLSCSREPADLEAAIFLYQQNDLEQALPIFEELSGHEPADPLVLAYLAETYRRFGKKERAVETARRALSA